MCHFPALLPIISLHSSQPEFVTNLGTRNVSRSGLYMRCREHGPRMYFTLLIVTIDSSHLTHNTVSAWDMQRCERCRLRPSPEGLETEGRHSCAGRRRQLHPPPPCRIAAASGRGKPVVGLSRGRGVRLPTAWHTSNQREGGRKREWGEGRRRT